MAGLRRLKPLLGSSHPLRRTLPLRPRLGRPNLGLTASGLHPMLKLGHPSVFCLEEVRLAGQHLPYFLWKTGMLKQPTKDSEGKDKYQKLTSAASCRSTSTNCQEN